MGKFELEGWMKGGIITGVSYFILQIPYMTYFGQLQRAGIYWQDLGVIVALGAFIGWLLDRFD